MIWFTRMRGFPGFGAFSNNRKSHQGFANLHHESQSSSSSKKKKISSIKLKLFRIFNKKAMLIIGALTLYTYVLFNTEYIYPSIINNTLKSINLLNDQAEQVLGKTSDPIAVLQSTIASTLQNNDDSTFEDYVQQYGPEDLRS